MPAPVPCITKACIICSAPVTRKPNAVRNRGFVTCSKACFRESLRKRIKRDLTGERFGRLLVIGRVAPNWECRCDCGAIVYLSGGNLKRQKSCGCWRNEVNGRANITHGATRQNRKNEPREYTSWRAIGYRCSNPKAKSFADYGGRGITLCERWKSYENFLADMGPCPPKFTIERINNDGNYEPGNCRWASRIDQAANTRGTKWVTFRGQTMRIGEACQAAGVSSVSYLKWRKAGISLEAGLANFRHNRLTPANQTQPDEQN